MNLHYITSASGEKKFVQIQIPIKEWEKADNELIIKKDKLSESISPQKKKFVTELKHALNQVELHQEGKIKLKTAKELLDEL